MTKNKQLFNTIVKITLLSLVLAISFFQFSTLPAQAAYTSMSDTMSRLKASTSADHTIALTAASGVNWDSGETLIIDFIQANGFDTSLFTPPDALDYDIKLEGADEAVVSAGDCFTDDAIEITSVDTTTDVFTFTACPNFTPPTLTGNLDIEIEIGLHASFGGNGGHQIGNPSSTGSKIIRFKGTLDPGTDPDGQLAVSIVLDDQVIVTASVDPTFTFAIYKPGTTDATDKCWRDSPPTLTGLGSIAGGSATVDTCKYDVYTSTNADGGYVTTILSESDGSNSAFNLDANPNWWFGINAPVPPNSRVDASLTGTYSEYGASSSDTDMGSPEGGELEILVTNDNLGNGDCADDAYSWVSASNLYNYSTGNPLSSPMEVAQETSPGNETATICHAATAGPVFTAGSYTHILTLISTGTF